MLPSNRADNTQIDYTNPPPPAWAENILTNIRIHTATAGLGTIEGMVTHQGNPVEGVTVFTDGISREKSVLTNELGRYRIPYVFPQSIDLTARKLGYFDSVLNNVVVLGNQSINRDFALNARQTFTVSGRIFSSDMNMPLEKALVRIVGYNTHNTVRTNLQGEFIFPAVYAESEYELIVSYVGYHSRIYPFEVRSTDTNLGIIIVEEFPFAPVNASSVNMQNYMEITWDSPNIPDPNNIWFTHTTNNVVGGLGRDEAFSQFVLAHRYTPYQ
jgi:hypothetical protein